MLIDIIQSDLIGDSLKSLASTAELHPILEPEAVSFSFDTLGWKIVFVLMFLLVLGLLWMLVSWYRANAYRREALRLVDEFEASENSNEAKVAESLKILKSLAILKFGRDKVAALKGKEWLVYLESLASGKVSLIKFDTMINKALYSSGALDANEVMEFNDNVKKWIRTHA
ncbi:DUF4381 domain-containing protein [Aureibacter tunicatorum]|uniref:DUF4381 domain-containing protein n=1 Tax=Aureibacter tunicatorum TaxID=866807 RepID=A0AAE3XK78_9BACT|nr:DUF4381 domain-containing protein [Aureibacter tunicatorum]MDR6238040.1 hypothetical protein [Aureibacter tunicatorum]BDD03073.1 hypothetical protein AUTU_05560 [Aureibacter tunicatorum]